MRAGDLHTIVVTSEQLGYIDMASRQSLKKDRKGAEKFGEDLDPDCSLAHRLRVGSDIEDIIAEIREDADARGEQDAEDREPWAARPA